MSNDRIWDLLTKKFNNEILPHELEELEKLLKENQDSVHVNELLSNFGSFQFKPLSDDAILRRSRDAIRKEIAIIDALETMEKLPGFNGNPQKHRASLIKAGAAILAAVLLLGVFAWITSRNKPYSGAKLSKKHEIKTEAGSKTTVILPDGSTVVLNGGSVLSYNTAFGNPHREIKLTGEAYFDIRKNPASPLVVHAGTVDIWVKGTSFNVKAYPKDSTFETVLLTGIIELISKKNPARMIFLKPNEKIVITNLYDNIVSTNNVGLHKNETVNIYKIKPDPVDSSYAETAWLQNKIIFHSESFKSIAHNMERKYDVAIHFLDNEVGNLIFTGSFSDEPLTDALEALKSTAPFQYKIDDKTVYIYK